MVLWGGAVAVCSEGGCGSMCWPVDRPATHAAAGAAARGVLIFLVWGILSHAREWTARGLMRFKTAKFYGPLHQLCGWTRHLGQQPRNEVGDVAPFQPVIAKPADGVVEVESVYEGDDLQEGSGHGSGVFLKKIPGAGAPGNAILPNASLRYGRLLHSRGGDQAPAAQADGEEALAFFRVL